MSAPPTVSDFIKILYISIEKTSVLHISKAKTMFFYFYRDILELSD